MQEVRQIQEKAQEHQKYQWLTSWMRCLKFDSKERFKMFRENRVEMLWLSPRISYIRGDGKPENRAPFQSGYLCSGICDRQLAFEYLLEKI